MIITPIKLLKSKKMIDLYLIKNKFVYNYLTRIVKKILVEVK